MISKAIHKPPPHAILLALIALLPSPIALADREPADDERMIDDPRVQHRSYTFAPTGEEIPYALFVPESYDPQSPAVVAPAPRDSQSPDDLMLFQHLPILVIHGDDDQTVPVGVSQLWVARMQELGMQHLYVEVSGGDHSLLISQTPENMKKVVDFFNITREDY